MQIGLAELAEVIYAGGPRLFLRNAPTLAYLGGSLALENSGTILTESAKLAGAYQTSKYMEIGGAHDTGPTLTTPSKRPFHEAPTVTPGVKRGKFKNPLENPNPQPGRRPRSIVTDDDPRLYSAGQPLATGVDPNLGLDILLYILNRGQKKKYRKAHLRNFTLPVGKGQRWIKYRSPWNGYRPRYRPRNY